LPRAMFFPYRLARAVRRHPERGCDSAGARRIHAPTDRIEWAVEDSMEDRRTPCRLGYRTQVDVAVSAERSALTGTHPQIRPRCTEHQQYMEGRESEEADASHPRRSTLCGDECSHGNRISGPAGPALGRFGRSGPTGSSRDKVLSDRFRS